MIMKKAQQTKETLQNVYGTALISHLSKNHSPQYAIKIANAAADGCALHQLYLDDRICEAHFHAGLAFAKLYGLAMRSFGIHNRVKTACQTWDQLYGITYDSFSNHRMEALWQYIMKALDPAYHDGLPMQQIAFSLVLTSNTPQSWQIEQVHKTLEYLQTIWEKIEDGPYRLGLFAYHQGRVYSKMH
jgi:hypothetical protein